MDTAKKRPAFDQLGTVIFPVILFFLAFLPRAFDLVARSTEWHERSILFMRAVAARDWNATLLAPHPGVTTMWLAGITNTLGRLFIPDFTELPRAQKMALEVVPLALVISLMIVLAYFLLNKLFGRREALLAATLLALDPFHLFISKTLHVDGLMSAFVMISALYMLLYIRQSDPAGRRYLLLSGIFAGLALLSKTPALFLLPYLLLCLGARELNRWLETQAQGLSANWRHWWRAAVGGARQFGLWLLIVVIVCFLLWPVMWTNPGEALSLSISSTAGYASAPAPKPKLFLGDAVTEDPGLTFYLTNILAKTTLVTLPGFALGLAALFNRRLTRQQRWSLLLLVAFVVFFTVQMTIGQKKAARYLLPAFQFIVVVAGLGIAYFLRWYADGRRSWQNLAITLVIGAQFFIAIPRHPYYGTHYNLLLGGPKVVLGKGILPGQEQGEGLDIAAEFLNGLPLSSLLVVGIEKRNPFDQYFQGTLVPTGDSRANYRVFDRNTLVRTLAGQDLNLLWLSYQDQEPALLVAFDEIPYVWVYKAGPAIEQSPLNNEVDVTVGHNIRLLGYEFEPAVAQPGESIQLKLQWQALQQPSSDYKVFTHLLDPSGQLQGQKDGRPQAGRYATYLWEEGERVQDEYELLVADNAPPGAYQIALGMYQPETLQRLQVSTENGVLPDGQFLIPGPEIIRPAE